ncbi:hypothetical protein C8Q70DRAFT_1069316 [Cubamyces menziesii]|nr:hypothetical protein C8Q70DRAFT_1069316 [Cubamyces menziesii]
MSSNEDNWVYVDDVDPRVVYSDGDWISSVHRGSSSGKPEAWNGSEIGVVASGFTNQDGWPAVDISIDGIRRILNTLPMGDVSTRSTRFTNPTILSSRFDPGDHVLTITSINGTASNPFWLDCIVIKPLSHSNNDLTASRPLPEGVSVSTGDVGSSKASSSSKRIELRSSYSLSFESSDFSRYTEATETGTPPAKNHTSVILGGILGGIVGAVLLALIGYYCFKHRKKYWYHADG